MLLCCWKDLARREEVTLLERKVGAGPEQAGMSAFLAPLFLLSLAC